MKSVADKKRDKVAPSALLPPSAFIPKKASKQKETYKKHESSDDDDEEDDDEEDDEFITDSESDAESDSDADSDAESDSDADADYNEDEDENDMLADKTYKKFLLELFPSHYMKQRVSSTQQSSLAADDLAKKSRKKTSTRICPGAPKKTKTQKKIIDESDESDSEEEDKNALSSTKNRRSGGSRINNSIISNISSNIPNELSKYNISFIIGGGGNNEEDIEYMSDTEALYDEYYDDTEGDSSEEDSDDDEDDTESDDDEDEKDIDCVMTEIVEDDKNNITQEKSTSKSMSKSSASKSSASKSSASKSSASKSSASKSLSTTSSRKDESDAYTKIKELFKGGLTPQEQENPIIKKVIEDINHKEEHSLKRQERQIKKTKVKNTKKLKKLFKDRDVMNDLQYFNEKMTIEEQEHALKQFELIKQHSDISKPYRLTLLESNIPPQYKATAYRKISTLKHMEPGGSEYFKMKNWVDTFMRIPFNQYKNLPLSLQVDGVDKCHEFMDNAKKILDQAVYGLEDAKLQIMQMIGQWIVNPSAIGTAIAIKGPMGTGKTTLVKEGISKILGRDFAFIALGGATDSSFLEGHSYTYEGSAWGKIVDLLIKCKSMNPVIYFDELDKISDTPKGEEIVGILTHLTDTSQNSEFHDRYFSDIDFDLSRCLFIFSYNDESKVNRILLDRMYRIQTKGYEQPQKTIIANKYLLPKICDQVKFDMSDITISDDTMTYIITNYTEKEDGVRTLKRCLEIIYTKLNLYRLMKPDTNLFENEMSIKVQFPMVVTPAVVDTLIKKNVEKGSWQNMYM
jgi:ATP-dependent Lon protease